VTEDARAKKRRKQRHNQKTTTNRPAHEELGKSKKKGFILIRAYSRRTDDTHIGEAKVALDTNGNLPIEHIAENLQLKGTLRVSR
jgi:hypothetical protein